MLVWLIRCQQGRKESKDYRLWEFYYISRFTINNAPYSRVSSFTCLGQQVRRYNRDWLYLLQFAPFWTKLVLSNLEKISKNKSRRICKFSMKGKYKRETNTKDPLHIEPNFKTLIYETKSHVTIGNEGAPKFSYEIQHFPASKLVSKSLLKSYRHEAER